MLKRGAVVRLTLVDDFEEDLHTTRKSLHDDTLKQAAKQGREGVQAHVRSESQAAHSDGKVE